MPLEVHAVQTESGVRFRVWDTGLRGYRTVPMAAGRMLQELGQAAHAGGIHPTPDLSSVLVGMVSRAEENVREAWADGCALRTTERNLLARSRFAYELARQLTDDLFEREIDTYLSMLGEDARRFLANTFVLRELLRGSGKATLAPRDGTDPAREGYRDRAHALELVEEVRKAWRWVRVETKDTGPDGACLVTFTLL